jgi:ribonuclease G
VLQWFRRKTRAAEEAPPGAARPVAREEKTAGPSRAGSPPGDPEKRPARRRGSRGGRGRKKTTDAPVGEPAKRAPKAAAEKEQAKEKEKAKERPKPRARRPRQPAPRPELPPVKKEILVSVNVGEQRVAVLEDGNPVEVYLERPGRRSIAGNVYKGVVDNVLPGMEASFVDVGLGRNGFLYVDEIVVPELEGKRQGRRIQELIERGQEVVVQAVKDPMGTKGARLTTEVSLPGRFLVYVPSGEGVGISRRLDDAERERLKAISKDLELPQGGIIIRTAAEGASKEEIEGDLALLQKLWSTIQGRAGRAEAPSLVYQEAELPLRIVRDLFIRDFERVVVDHDRTHRRIVGYLKRTSKDLAERVELYTGKEPLMEREGVEAAVRSTLNRRVDLPSGGYLIFDYAEAFTVIDVNTGRFVGGRGKASTGRLEDTITKNNLEAVQEVVRQLRLRDIGGIIVIDFIDMANPKNRELVEEALRRELERDRTKTYVVEISPLGLVEMTRQNVTDGPREILTIPCPTCDGDGIVVSDETNAVDAERRLRALVATSRSQAFRVEMNSRVAGILIGPGASRLDELEQETGRRFFFETKDDLPSDHFVVLEKGPISRMEAKALPVASGDELDLKLEAVHMHDEADAIARLDGYVISVAGAGRKVGQTVKVRIERATRTVAYAVLSGAAAVEPPVEAGVELETETPGIAVAAKAASPAKKPQKRTRGGGRALPKPSDDEDAEPDAEAPTAASAETKTAEEKPKKRTRRGSRGGRGRKKKVPAGAEAGGAESGAGVAAVAPSTEDDAAVEATDGDASKDDSGEPSEEKPKKRTRRGSRGGRNRRRSRPAGATSDETIATVAGEEDPG